MLCTTCFTPHPFLKLWPVHSRSLSSGGSYADEGIYIERRSTANSSKAPSGPNSAGGRRSYDSGTGGDKEDVPKPFRYHSPTKEDLERSGPIPEHIVSPSSGEGGGNRG